MRRKSIYGYTRKYRLHMVVGPAFKMFEAIIELLIPILMANIIDIGLPGNDRSYILRTGLLIVVLVIISFFTTMVCQKVAAIAAQGFGTKLRQQVFKQVMEMSPRQFDQFSTSTLTTRLSMDIVILQDAFARVIRIVLRAPFLLIGSIVMAMTINLKMSLIFLLVTPLITIFVFLILKLTTPLFKRIHQQLDTLVLKVRENLFGIRLIKSFNKEAEVVDQFEHESDEYLRLSRKVYRRASLLSPGIVFIINLALLAIIYYGGVSVSHGEMNTGHIIAFIEYLTQIQLSIIIVCNLSVFFNKAFASKRRVEEILNCQVEGNAKFTTIEAIPDQLIHFDDVHFSFSDSEEEILSGLTFTIKKGERIGIVGATGSGKSVLAQVIAGLYRINQGELLLAGVPIANLSREEINSLVTLTLQKSVLFTGTVRSNLEMGVERDDETLMTALGVAQIDDFIRPLGLDYQVVEGGKNFSGGQKQRMAIARSLLRSSPIMIFDDSFSALDLLTEARLKRDLINNYPNTTLIIISQRISTVRNLDRIMVLDKGHLIAFAPHQELVETCPLYQEIIQSQHRGDV